MRCYKKSNETKVSLNRPSHIYVGSSCVIGQTPASSVSVNGTKDASHS